MNLVETLNNSPYDFYFLVVDDFLDIKVPELTNFISLSPASLNIDIAEKNSGRLLSHPTTIKFIQDHSAATRHTPVIVPFKPSAKIDLICRQLGWILASNPSKINRFFEDKIKFYQTCHHLPLIPSLILEFNQSNYLQAQKQFGPKMVLQTHFGWAGNSSYISQNYSDSPIPENTLVKFSPYLTGYSLINNCCLTKNGLVQSPPGLQYTGLPEITSNPLATVGRQWPSFTSPDVNSQVEKITNDFSLILQQHHYRGFFGLDFLVSNNIVYLIECNPRLTASFALYTAIEKNHHLTPLFFLHLAEFLGIDYPEATHFNQDLVGSEIVNKNTHRKHLAFTAFSSTADPVSIDPQIISQVL